MDNNILEIKDLKTSFYTHVGEVEAVRGVSVTVKKGETLGIVGESGSGKSVTLLSILRLIKHPGKIKSGEIIFQDQDLLKLSAKKLMKIRGNKIAMISQDPMSSLNPVFRIGNQIVETIRTHQDISLNDARKRAVELLEMVGIPSPEKRLNNYPHEFSGGMRQRAMIAMALACNPQLLIADEPTTALDVTIQAQILSLIKDIKEKEGTTVILVTHDLGVVAELCDKVIVMYGGLIMEEGTVGDIFYRSAHPYTIGLLKSIPKIHKNERHRLIPIEGSPPDLVNAKPGCPFSQRCPHTMEICLKKTPEKFVVAEGHKSSCWLCHPESPRINIRQDLEVKADE